MVKKTVLIPKIYNINFWIKNSPTPPWHFFKNSSYLVAGPFPKLFKKATLTFGSGGSVVVVVAVTAVVVVEVVVVVVDVVEVVVVVFVTVVEVVVLTNCPKQM